MPIEKIDIEKINKKADSVYEACVVISKRARQINTEINEEFKAQLGDIETEEELTEEELDRREVLIELEKKEKPIAKAAKEMMNGKLHFEYKKKE